MIKCLVLCVQQCVSGMRVTGCNHSTKFRFAKNVRDSTFFKLFFHIFAAIIEAQVFIYPPHRMRPPAMLATFTLHLSGHRRRQIACRPGTSLGVGRGENHLAPNQGCTGGGPFVST